MADGIRIFAMGGAPATELIAGVRARGVFGEDAMINIVELDPGAELPLHSHPHEQLGLILRGIQILEVDGVEHRLGEFQGYVLGRDVPHAGRGGPEGCLVIDVFQPVREDYRDAFPAVPDLVDASS